MEPLTSREAAREAGGTTLRVLVAGGAVGGAYLLFLGHRTDYVGHYLAGFGGTLLPLALLLGGLLPPLRWSPPVVAGIAIALGGLLEATVFRFAIFDPVDFGNQSLGAVLAATACLGRRPHLGAAAGVGLLGAAFLSAGFHYAFA